MGIFSTKKKHFVDTQIQRLLENDQIADQRLVTLTRSWLDDRPLMDVVLEHAALGPGQGFDQMINFGKKSIAQGGYFYGLPADRLLNSGDGEDIVRSLLSVELENSQDLKLEYMHYRPINTYHVGFKALIDEWGYLEKDHSSTVLSDSVNAGRTDDPDNEYPATVYITKLVAVDNRVTPESTALASFEQTQFPISGPNNGNQASNYWPFVGFTETVNDIGDIVLTSAFPPTNADGTPESNSFPLTSDGELNTSLSPELLRQSSNKANAASSERKLGTAEYCEIHYEYTVMEIIPDVEADSFFVDTDGVMGPPGQVYQTEQPPNSSDPVGQPLVGEANPVLNAAENILGEEILEDTVVEPARHAVKYEDVFYVELKKYEEDEEYFQAKYTFAESVYGPAPERKRLEDIIHTGYWEYSPSSLTWPITAANGVSDVSWFYEQLNDLYDVYKDYWGNVQRPSRGTYFPIAIFRSYNKSKTAGSTNQNSAAYKSSVKLLNHIKLDYAAIGQSLDENSDIENIRQAVLMMGIPIDSENPLDMEYLYNFWEQWFKTLPAKAQLDSKSGLIFDVDYGARVDDIYAIDISDADFRMVLSFNGILQRLGEGNILDAALPTTNVATNRNNPDKPYQDFPANEDTILNLDVLTNLDYRPGIVNTYTNTAEYLALRGPNSGSRQMRIFRKQETPDTYTEIIVLEPRFRFDIYEDKHTFGGATDSKCLIPIDHEISQKMALYDREELYLRSLSMVFNSHVVQKKKWWQRGWFKIVLVILAIVYVWYTWDASTAWALATTEAGVGATTYAITVVFIQKILIQIAIGVAISYATQLIARAVGGKIGMLLAIAALVYTAYLGYTGTLGIAGATPLQMLAVGNGLTRGVQLETQREMANFVEELAEFNLMAEEKFEELAEKQALLDPDGGLDLHQSIGFSILYVANEAPEEYYSRLTDPGTALQGTELIRNYAADSLRLPEGWQQNRTR